jgi:hypothetical protein
VAFALSAAALSAAALSAAALSAAADEVSVLLGGVADVAPGGVGSSAKAGAPIAMHKVTSNTFVGLISIPSEFVGSGFRAQHRRSQ